MQNSTPAIQSFAKKARIALYFLVGLSVLGWVMPEFLGIGDIDITVTDEEISVTNPDIQTGSQDGDFDELEIPAWFDIFMILSTLLIVILWLMIIFQIDRLFAAFQKGELFTSLTARRISNIGWIMLGTAIISSLQEIIDSILFEDLIMAAGENVPDGMSALMTSASIDYPILIGALAITVIARVMKTAADLQEEMNSVI